MFKKKKLLIVIPSIVILTFALSLGVIAAYDIIRFSANNPSSQSPEISTVPTPLPQDSTGSVSGYVFESDNITPIIGAVVSINRFTWKSDDLIFSSQTTTNNDGSYLFSGLPPGKYYLRASAKDHIYKNYPGQSGIPMVYAGNESPDLTDYVSVSANNTSQDINFSLDIGSSITGYVYDASTGKPIEDAEICAQTPNGAYIVLTKSRADGSYNLSGMVSGRYNVSCYKHDSDYVFQVYPEGMRLDYLEYNVEVKNSINTEDINFHLNQGGSLSGFVFTAFGDNPLYKAHLNISLILLVNNQHYYTTATSNPDGGYLIKGLPLGDYKVSASASNYYPNGEIYTQQVSVSANNNTSNVNFNLNRAYYIKLSIKITIGILIVGLIILWIIRLIKTGKRRNPDIESSHFNHTD